MLSIYPSVHNLLFGSFLTFFEAHIVVQILQAVNNYFMLGDGAIYVSILILLAIATLFTVAGHQKTTFLALDEKFIIFLVRIMIIKSLKNCHGLFCFGWTAKMKEGGLKGRDRESKIFLYKIILIRQ